MPSRRFHHNVRNNVGAKVRPQIFLALLLLVLSWAALLAAGGLIARSLQRNDTGAIQSPGSPLQPASLQIINSGAISTPSACDRYHCDFERTSLPVYAVPQPATQEIGSIQSSVHPDDEHFIL